MKWRELNLKNRAYQLIEKTKKSYKKFLEERKFLLSFEYLELKDEEDYIFFNSKLCEIEAKVILQDSKK